MENGNAPATKQDVERLRSAMKQDVEQLRSEMSHIHQDLVEQMREVETRLLKAFYGFADTNQKRLDHIETDEEALRKRVSSIEGRLLEVEKRLNMPPSAA